ncbi:MAG: hypothetical protein VX264_02545, partial [Chloroflexota bacterium]|nr:hypothetical protein [Chloroflexota bacterium]
ISNDLVGALPELVSAREVRCQADEYSERSVAVSVNFQELSESGALVVPGGSKHFSLYQAVSVSSSPK